MPEINRRDFLRQMAAGAAVAALPTLGRAASSSRLRSGKRPNIVFLYSDDQRFNTIHALGNDEIVTPTMDSLARDGVAFTHTFIMGGTHGAICVASRAMLMTGETLYRAMAVNDTMFPEALQKAGYTTYGIGKWHNGPPAYARAFSGGANIFFGGMGNHLKVPVYDFDPTGKYPKANVRIGEKFSSELFSDSAIQFLREYKEDRPFFLYVAYTAPHDPRMAPPKYKDIYPPDKIPLPKNFMPEHPFDNGDLKVRDEQLAPWPRTPEVVRRNIADYYAMITHLDEQMGRVLAALKETGHENDTIVIFTGDNGLALGQHGLFGKQNLYEHSARVPMIIAGPGIPKGQQCDALVYQFDLCPTICDLTGTPIPPTVESQSLVPLIRGEKKQTWTTIFGSYRDYQRMVRDREFKLIEYYVGADGKGTRKTQLFDIVKDPWELNDLSADPKYAGELDRLRGELKAWMEKTDDPLLKPAAASPTAGRKRVGGKAKKAKAGKTQ
jgi:arylsulfatase A-like enzyme